MPSIFFTTNPAEFTRVEGVYVSERKPPAAIAGVFLGVVCVVGECVRGPVDTMTEITSPARFAEVFGGRDRGSGGSIMGKVWQSMIGKPFGKLLVVRAAASGAVVASQTYSGPATFETGTITTDTEANHASGDLIVVNDGFDAAVTFELRKSGSASAGHIGIDISGDTTAASVAATVKTSIDSQISGNALALTSSISSAVITLVETGTTTDLVLSKTSSSALAVATSTRLSLLETLLNAMKTAINAHIGSGTDFGPVRVVPM